MNAIKIRLVYTHWHTCKQISRSSARGDKIKFIKLPKNKRVRVGEERGG